MLQWLLIFIAGLLLGNYIRRKKRSSMLSTAPAQPLPNAGEILKSSGIDPRFIFGQQVGSETSLAALPAIQGEQNRRSLHWKGIMLVIRLTKLQWIEYLNQRCILYYKIYQDSILASHPFHRKWHALCTGYPKVSIQVQRLLGSHCRTILPLELQICPLCSSSNRCWIGGTRCWYWHCTIL